MNNTMLAFTCAAALVPVAAFAQPNLVFNPSFEEPAASAFATGWQTFNAANVSSAAARTGLRSMALPTDIDNAFVGATTNVFNPETLGYYDPAIQFPGGDITVKGWYMIPTGQALQNCNSGLKLEFRRANTSIFAAYESLNINQSTNGVWVQTSMTVTNAQLQVIADEFPPGPVAVSVLPIRFGANPNNQSGIIYWDDLEVTQGNPCPADRDGNGLVEPTDIAVFINDWFTSISQGTLVGDFDGNGVVEPADIAGFISAWFTAVSTGHCP
ncbi:MAG: hypothetical protein KF745_00105 [Phycisphaeraceae bacterium]|nr:hypothetical protein [Phycisphaeraceae bacterium]